MLLKVMGGNGRRGALERASDQPRSPRTEWVMSGVGRLTGKAKLDVGRTDGGSMGRPRDHGCGAADAAGGQGEHRERYADQPGRRGCIDCQSEQGKDPRDEQAEPAEGAQPGWPGTRPRSASHTARLRPIPGKTGRCRHLNSWLWSSSQTTTSATRQAPQINTRAPICSAARAVATPRLCLRPRPLRRAAARAVMTLRAASATGRMTTISGVRLVALCPR